MTLPPEAVLVALQALAPWHGDRSLADAERTEMLRPVAVAIAAVSRTVEEASFLAAQAHHESALASHLIRGECRRHECDPDRHGKPQSVGVWQVKERYCTDSATLEGQARCALRMARHGRMNCPRTGWLAAFSAQAGAGACNAPWARVRVSTMSRMRGVIQREMWKAKERTEVAER